MFCRNGSFLIGKSTHELQANFVDLPKFLRFNTIWLFCCYSGLSIVVKRQYFLDYLTPLKEELKDTDLVNFVGTINQNDRSCFTNSSQLLNHIQFELLSIFDSSRGYQFNIWFHSDTNSGTNVVVFILKLPQIICGSNAEIRLHNLVQPTQLPIETISNFLHRKRDGSNGKAKVRTLLIYSNNIQNVRELCDQLKKVIIAQFIFSRTFLYYLRSDFYYFFDKTTIVGFYGE